MEMRSISKLLHRSFIVHFTLVLPSLSTDCVACKSRVLPLERYGSQSEFLAFIRIIHPLLFGGKGIRKDRFSLFHVCTISELDSLVTKVMGYPPSLLPLALNFVISNLLLLLPIRLPRHCHKDQCALAPILFRLWILLG